MTNNINPFLLTDSYKVNHHLMYPKGTTLVYSNFTARSGKHSNVNTKGIISFGQQMVMMQINKIFSNNFFCQSKENVINEINAEYMLLQGSPYDTSHIEELHDLGYLPIKVKALPEGTFVPYGVPCLTIVNTNPNFFWLTNFLETIISNLLWKPMTSATTAYEYKRLLTEWALKTDKDNVGFVSFQGHDFSMRGMDSIDATIASGLGHATSFMGSDSLPVIHGAREYYGADGFIIGSVAATEHSVMCAGTKDDEIGTFRELMDTFPKGILSVVSDTWDLWKVLTEYLPEMKEEILARDGKLVIRPDSGDPVDIICGFPDDEVTKFSDDQWYINGKATTEIGINEKKGVIELLWDLFGGTVNEQGYKVLDTHIGAIYGDSITLARAEDICKRLEAKGFASTNIVLGIGSYTYQYNTRDTHGFAMKATYVEVCNPGKNSDWCVGNCKDECNPIGREIFKDPVTDDGTKKSAKGLLAVGDISSNQNKPNIILFDQMAWEEEAGGLLQTIFEDGKVSNTITLEDIREKLSK